MTFGRLAGQRVPLRYGGVLSSSRRNSRELHPSTTVICRERHAALVEHLQDPSGTLALEPESRTFLHLAHSASATAVHPPIHRHGANFANVALPRELLIKPRENTTGVPGSSDCERRCSVRKREKLLFTRVTAGGGHRRQTNRLVSSKHTSA